jgi:tetratricopeptide (TPR) repeat protein
MYVNGFEETDIPGAEGGGYDDALSVSGSYDPYGTASVNTPTAMTPGLDPELGPPGRAESLVEDDLEEADFYASQGMYDEAIEALQVLLARYPNQPLILAKLRDIQAMQVGDASLDTPPSGHHTDLQQAHVADDEADGTDAIELDDLEEVSADDMIEVDEPEGHAPGGHVPGGKRKPTVMLERPVEEGDADTHYDLGLAYKEMGLFDEAIKAFEKVLLAPGREAQCRIMLGMCMREQGNPTAAIHQFKQGLHADASDRERISLYYEIGATYEVIRDDGEALYYFESILKRDPGFADARQRADMLRARMGAQSTPRPDDI